MPTLAAPPPTPARPRSRPARKVVPATPRPVLAAGRSRWTGTSLPGWADLDRTAGTAPGVARHPDRLRTGTRTAARFADRKAGRLRPLDAVPSLRFGLLTLFACVVGTLFVAHVYATRATLADLQEARREHDHLRLAQQRLRGEFDQMTGPDAVMPRALALGLEEGIAYGVPIRLGE